MNIFLLIPVQFQNFRKSEKEYKSLGKTKMYKEGGIASRLLE